MLQSLHSHQRAIAGYVAPFVAYIFMLAVDRLVPLPAPWMYSVRLLVVAALILLVSRPYLSLRPTAPGASIVVGIVVFLAWVAPDVLFGYRHHWVFENIITGAAASSLNPELKKNLGFILLRSTGSVLVIPILEELFWRGWMMRRLIDRDFLKVPMGKYVPAAFWIVAVLFASEHGPYWEVGLVAGIIYNWWIIRTKNLADCILAHAVTNGVLAAYVLVTSQWQYWL